MSTLLVPLEGPMTLLVSRRSEAEAVHGMRGKIVRVTLGKDKTEAATVIFDAAAEAENTRATAITGRISSFVKVMGAAVFTDIDIRLATAVMTGGQ